MSMTTYSNHEFTIRIGKQIVKTHVMALNQTVYSISLQDLEHVDIIQPTDLTGSSDNVARVGEKNEGEEGQGIGRGGNEGFRQEL